jgi:predicted nucleic acid-binding protein
MEYLRGARDADEYHAFEQSLRAYPWLRIELVDWERAMDVSRQLAAVSPGYHRGVPIPDLLIAAVAERHGATLAHDDADYERIAVITGQGLVRLGRQVASR